MAIPIDHNLHGQDYQNRAHLRHRNGGLIDVHAHMHLMKGKLETETFQAELLVNVALEFGVRCLWTMSPSDHIVRLKERFGDLLIFNGYIDKATQEPDDAVYRRLDQYLEAGVRIIKLWAGPKPRGRDALLDVPWRFEIVRRSINAGIRVFMAHVADPDIRFRHAYDDQRIFSTKQEHYSALEKMLLMFPEVTWIVAHMGGWPENPDRLESLLERHANLYFDTSATRWQVREVSCRHERFHDLISRWSDRFLFGSDLVTRPASEREHYVSRYWCQRTLWESQYRGQSPIADEDWKLENPTASPLLCGLSLPDHVLDKLYFGNAFQILPISSQDQIEVDDSNHTRKH